LRLIPVFDTSILFSATAWRGRPFQCVAAARSAVVEGITCREILDELAEKLETKLRFSPAEATDTVTDLLTFLRLVEISGPLHPVASDPDDDKIVECAIAGGATHIVTSDRRHLLPMDGYHGIRIVTAADFLAELSTP
jgi:uncharacterized protein